MRKIIFILLMLYCWLVGATTYYVQSVTDNASASDSNAGTNINLPFATIQHAFDILQAGDTLYLRGSIWYPTIYVTYDPSANHGDNGTYNNHVCIFNYPNENPIIDGSQLVSTTNNNVLEVRNATYVELKGIEVRNMEQNVADQYVAAVQIVTSGVIWLERIVSHGNWGHGFQWAGYDTLYVTNCDSYDNADSISYSQGVGNRADGFAGGSGGSETDTFKVAYYTGCRAWHNSDDGFDLGTSKQFQVTNCWSFNNGYLEQGAGVAFKTGPCHSRTTSQRRINRCLSAFNRGVGHADQNLTSETLGPRVEYSNNTVYRCLYGFQSDLNAFDCVNGFGEVIYRNNVVYDSRNSYLDQIYLTACGANPPTYTIQHHNTWIPDFSNIPYYSYNDTLNWSYSGHDDEFVILDSASAVSELIASRKADGSLPDITFMTLTAGSVLIDAGTDVGLPFNGTAPDLGYAEYGTALPSSAKNITAFTISCQTGSSTINSTNHTVSVTMPYGTSVTSLSPTITVSTGGSINPTSGTARNFTSAVTYTVTAEDESTQVWTVTVSVASAPPTSGTWFGKSGGRYVKTNNRFAKVIL